MTVPKPRFNDGPYCIHHGTLMAEEMTGMFCERTGKPRMRLYCEQCRNRPYPWGHFVFFLALLLTVFGIFALTV